MSEYVIEPLLLGLNETEWWMVLEQMNAHNCKYTVKSGFNEHFEYIVKTQGDDYYEITEFAERITCVKKLEENKNENRKVNKDT